MEVDVAAIVRLRQTTPQTEFRTRPTADGTFPSVAPEPVRDGEIISLDAGWAQLDHPASLVLPQRRQRGKRAVDLALSVLVLIAVIPVLLVTAIAIKLDDGGPVFYRQKRVG